MFNIDYLKRDLGMGDLVKVTWHPGPLDKHPENLAETVGWVYGLTQERLTLTKDNSEKSLARGLDFDYFPLERITDYKVLEKRSEKYSPKKPEADEDLRTTPRGKP